MSDSPKLVTISSAFHHQVLASGLWNLYSSKHRLDFEFQYGERSISMHQLVVDVFLSSSLAVQHGSGVNPAADGSALPANHPTGSLDSLVEFLYRGTVTVPEDTVDGLLEIARQLDFKLLVDAVALAKSSDVDVSEAAPVSVRPRRTTSRQRRKGNPVKLAETGNDSQSEVDDDVEDDEEWSSSPPAKKRGRFAAITESRRTGSLRSSSRRLRPKSEPDTATSDTTNTIEPSEDQNPEVLTEGDGVTDIAAEEEGEQRQQPVRRRKQAARASKTASRAAGGGKSNGSGKRGGRSNAEQCRRWIGRQEMLKCGHCEFETRRKALFELHLAKHDPTIKIYKCAKCSKTFLDHEASLRHEQSVHTGEPERYQCSMCEYSTPNKRSHRTHVRAVHREEWRERRAEARAANQHRCDQCDFSALHACKLKLHVLMKHSEGQEKPYKCHEEQCNYSSIRKSDLEKHVNGAHLRLRPFVCEMCGQACAHQTALKQHLRTHTGEKPYVCGQCGQAYGDPSSFKQHLKRHVSDEKPYVCHLCGHRCRRRDNLRVHLKGVHKTTLEMVSSVLQA